MAKRKKVEKVHLSDDGALPDDNGTKVERLSAQKWAAALGEDYLSALTMLQEDDFLRIGPGLRANRDLPELNAMLARARDRVIDLENRISEAGDALVNLDAVKDIMERIIAAAKGPDPEVEVTL